HRRGLRVRGRPGRLRGHHRSILEEIMGGCSGNGVPHPPKSVAHSRVTQSYMMQPHDANPVGIVHGGVVMKHIDDALQPFPCNRI
ncbi:MAG: hypothetical protein WBY88_11310, partial [Desulfosarcina sp.]